MWPADRVLLAVTVAFRPAVHHLSGATRFCWTCRSGCDDMSKKLKLMD